jgi:hypothetical protein
LLVRAPTHNETTDIALAAKGSAARPPLLPEFDDAMRRLQRSVAERLGVYADFDEQLPEHIVANSYGPHESIGIHSDDWDIFDAVEGPAVIISLNLQADGILWVRPQLSGTMGDKLTSKYGVVSGQGEELLKDQQLVARAPVEHACAVAAGNSIIHPGF